MIGVIDYGAGNLASVMNMLRSLSLQARLVRHADDVDNVKRLVLPGVGHFDYGMTQLASRGLVAPLHQAVREQGVPLMGICLGAQLIARRSEEGTLPGLGWLDADVIAFDRSRMAPGLRVPHMGWAETWPMSELRTEPTTTSVWAEALLPESRFYYVHSFHLECDEGASAILRAHHGYEFAAAAECDNVVGFQFHPEKSHRFGRRILEAFASWEPRKGSDVSCPH